VATKINIKKSLNLKKLVYMKAIISPKNIVKSELFTIKHFTKSRYEEKIQKAGKKSAKGCNLEVFFTWTP
jgi:hypothetical protein